MLAPASAVVHPRWPGEPALVLQRVAEHTGVAVEALGARVRQRHVVSARRVALMRN